MRRSISGAVVTTVVDAQGIEWELYDYGDGDVIHQRRCPDCNGGLLLAPARFHARCGGSGFLVGTPRTES